MKTKFLKNEGKKYKGKSIFKVNKGSKYAKGGRGNKFREYFY